MIVWIAMAFAGGVFVALSRQINGRLSLSNSPLIASFWNHIVGFAVLTVIGLIVGGLIPPGAADAPWLAFIGGPIGVVFIASEAGSSRASARSIPHFWSSAARWCQALRWIFSAIIRRKSGQARLAFFSSSPAWC